MLQKQHQNAVKKKSSARAVLTFIFTIFYFLHNLLYLFPYISVALIPRWAVFVPWTVLTSLFTHADFEHFLSNTIGLWRNSGEVEKKYSKDAILKIFLICGVLDGLITLLTYTGGNYSYVGASGAIMGIVAMNFSLLFEQYRFGFIIALIMTVRSDLLSMWMLQLTKSRSPINHLSHLRGAMIGFALYYGEKWGWLPEFDASHSKDITQNIPLSSDAINNDRAQGAKTASSKQITVWESFASIQRGEGLIGTVLWNIF